MIWGTLCEDDQMPSDLAMAVLCRYNFVCSTFLFSMTALYAYPLENNSEF